MVMMTLKPPKEEDYEKKTKKPLNIDSSPDRRSSRKESSDTPFESQYCLRARKSLN